MAFRVVLALVPFLLFLLALIGFLNLEEVWREDVAPEVEDNASAAAFRLIDDTVKQVLSQKQLWWLTAGLALTLWELSSATRVTMVALDRVYGFNRRRGWSSWCLARSPSARRWVCAWSWRWRWSGSGRSLPATSKGSPPCCRSSCAGCSPARCSPWASA